MDPDTPSASPPPVPGPVEPWWPVPEGTIITSPTPPSAPRPKGRRVLVVVALAAGLVAVAAAAVMALGARAGGSDSPESAVEAMFTALGNEDLAGMVAVMPPGESGPMVRAFGDLGPELRRLGLLPEDFDIRKVPGIDLTFTDLAFQTEDLTDDRVAVHVVGGKVTAEVTPADLPIGDWLRDQLPADALTGLPDSSSVTEDLSGDDLFLVAVREDGSWYASLWDTVAELARREAGAPLPDPSRRLTPHGAATPEGAVEALIGAAADLDLRRVLELLPPDEAAALYDYAPLFLDDVEAAAARAGETVGIAINSVDTTATVDGDRALVTVDGFDVELTEPTLGQTVSIVYDGECLVVSGELGLGMSGELLNTCDPTLTDPGGLGLELPPALQDLTPAAGMGLVVVQRDGSWFVSPTETLGNALVQGLRMMDRSTLDGLADLFSGLDPMGLAEFDQSSIAY